MTYTVTLQASGKQFEIADGETVLEAAQRSGLALPYSCLAGVCGSCKATLISGSFRYGGNPPTALSGAEQARGKILLCQAVACSDLVIAAREVASVADIPRRQLDLRVLEKSRVAEDVVQLMLEPEGGPLRRLPGQYLDVLLPGGKRRAFSIANAPHTGTALELHVRHVAGGGFTSFVFEKLEVGMTLHGEGPLGTFVPREDSERPIIFVAGGTGFAPVKALIEHFLEIGTRREMTLVWGARSKAELYYPQLPQRWANGTPPVRFLPVISDPERSAGLPVGLAHEAVLAEHPDLTDFDIYMSGPPALIDAGRHAFVDAGLPEDRLYYDSFDYAPDILAKILGSRAGIHGW